MIRSRDAKGFVRLLVATCALALLGASGCRSPLLEPLEPPDVALVGLTPAEGGAFEQRVRVTLRLTNPNNEVIDVDGLRFEIALNDRPFTRGVSNEAFTLDRLDEATVEVFATTTLIDWMRQLGALSEQQELRFDYAIEGRIFLARGGSLDFVRAGELGR